MKNRRTAQFRQQFAALPSRIQDIAKHKYRLFLEDPSHPSLRVHELADTRRGSHQCGSRSVSITMQYRAIYVTVDGVNLWYWVGTHAEYDAYIGSV